MFFLNVSRAKPNVDPEEVGRGLPAHRAWVEEQLAAGRLLLAGKWGRGAGVWIIRAESLGSAQALVELDPLMVSGLVTSELDSYHPQVERVSFE